MGSNGFSSERKQKRVDLLKQLLDTNISTQGSSNPLEALLSGLDLGSLEGLMQKNKKSHHDDWDSKKKRHHDDCSDHDWDHKKKHDHDDCGCKKKKHDHDDWDHKKKRHHDDCGCDGHKHHKNPCDKCFKHDCCCKDKNKKRCRCSSSVKDDICAIISAIFVELENNPDQGDLKNLLKELRDLLDMCSHIPEKFLDELDDLIDDLNDSGSTPPTIINRIERFLNKLLKCLNLDPEECGDGGGGGACNCSASVKTDICALIDRVLTAIGTANLTEALQALATFLASDAANCIRQGVRQSLSAIVNNILRNGVTPGRIVALINALGRLEECVGGCPPSTTVPTTPTTPLTTIRERLLDLLADQVVITTPTGLYAGTLVAVQVDYIAVVAPTGTYLIPLDQIQTFTTE